MEEKKTLLFIFNPFSGKAQIKNQLMDIVDTMVKAGYEVTIYPTQAPEDAIHKVEVDAEKYDLVVCSGGDGTLDEVVSGIMHKGLAVSTGSDSHVGDNQGNGVSVVGKEVSKTAEPVFRVTAHAAYLFAVHAAFGKSGGKNSRADRGKNPGENGNRTDFRECCRQKNNAGSHHVDGGDCGELYHSHFSAFRQCSSLLSRTNFRHIFGTGEDICPESHRNARFSGIGNPHLLSLW